MPDGRTLECHYQCDVKAYNPGGTNWRDYKGKPPLDPSIDLYHEYKGLWLQWVNNNYTLFNELRVLAVAHGGLLTDCFATTEVSQARALAELLNDIPL